MTQKHFLRLRWLCAVNKALEHYTLYMIKLHVHACIIACSHMLILFKLMHEVMCTHAY